MPTIFESDRLPGIIAGSSAAPSGEEGAVVRLDQSNLESLAGLPGRTRPRLIDQLHEGLPNLASAAPDRICVAAARGDWADACRAAFGAHLDQGRQPESRLGKALA